MFVCVKGMCSNSFVRPMPQAPTFVYCFANKKKKHNLGLSISLGLCSFKWIFAFVDADRIGEGIGIVDSDRAMNFPLKGKFIG